MLIKRILLIIVCWFIFLSCNSSSGQKNTDLEVKVAFPNLTFTRPVDLTYADDGTNRLFVVEQQGRIYSFENDSKASEKQLFLDIRERVDDRGNEEGLLGLAFHPDYKDNGYFFIDYTATNPDRTVIARYKVDPSNSNQALKSSEFIILEVEQPYSNHNGGQIIFGPDNYLYISLGDGGSAGDPHNNGQDPSTLLGSILRINIDKAENRLNYSIPKDNPFAGNTQGFREEIYAYGLRNPWRMSFDSETGLLWTGDVGQNKYEEIDIIRKGNNYGWNIMEGLHCYRADNCDSSGLTMPIWEYSHDLGQSITGGYVYRGDKFQELKGKYIYADYVSGKIWALDYNQNDRPTNLLLLESNLNWAAFGIDQNENLFICAFDGKIYGFK